MNDFIFQIQQINPDAIILDGFDDCIIGIGSQYGMNDVFIYNSEAIIQKMTKLYDLSYEDALEFYDLNIACAYMGENTPILATMVKEKKQKKSNKLIDIL